MDINLQIDKQKQFNSFYLFFIIAAMQFGVGMIGTPRILFVEAGHDAWISIIIAYLFILLILLAMIYILKQYENTDILGVQTDLFGTFISKLLGTVYVLYFLHHLLATILIYIEIVKVFVFPDMPSFVLGVMLLILVVYASIGGLRVVIGVCFLFMIFSYWLIFLLYEPIRQMDFLNFLPIMDSSIGDILRGTVATAYTFAGFEILFFIYPFIQNKERIKKPIILGFTFVTVLVLGATVTAIGFLSPDQLERRVWPVLNLFKIQTTPIVERLDYIVVAEWMMVTVPRLILLMWCVSYILKRIYKMPKNISLYATAGVLLCIIPLFTQHFEIQVLIDSSRYISYGLIYIYPLILLPLVIIKKKIRKKR